MTQPRTTPLIMSPKLLFAPADGQTYRPEDKDRAFAQQPIEGPSLPDYLVPSRSTFLKPPTLVYGWRLGHDKLMQIALDHFPQAVHYRAAPATLGLGNEENEEYTEEDWAHERPNIAETIFDYDFIEAILKYLGLGPEADKLLTVVVFYDSQREAEWGLTVGSNYLKLLKEEYVQKLEALIAPDEPAMWYLRYRKWMWRRIAAPKAKSKTTTESVKPTRKPLATNAPPDPTPLNLPPEYLFAPEDGKIYYMEDMGRVFAQQPLEGPTLPNYLMPSRSSTLKPPTLVYGWRLGHEKLMQIALDHFPHVVRHRKGPATLGFGDEDSEDETDEVWAHECPNIAETIFDDGFAIAIREHLGIGPEGDKLFNVDLLHDSQRRAEYGLTVGSNYLKVIDKESLEKLEALIASDEPAKWYLHCEKWMWRRVVPKARSKTESKRSARDPNTADTVDAASVPVS